VSAGIDSVASPQPVRLDPISIEAIARRVAELLGQDAPLLDAAAVARRLGRSRDWVYDHAAELGSVQLGNGKRPRLGFEPAKVADYLDACESSRRTGDGSNAVTTPTRRTERGGSIGQGADLLPIRGDIPPR